MSTPVEVIHVYLRADGSAVFSINAEMELLPLDETVLQPLLGHVAQVLVQRMLPGLRSAPAPAQRPQRRPRPEAVEPTWLEDEDDVGPEREGEFEDVLVDVETRLHGLDAEVVYLDGAEPKIRVTIPDVGMASLTEEQWRRDGEDPSKFVAEIRRLMKGESNGTW